jgi:hypothetical protein
MNRSMAAAGAALLASTTLVAFAAPARAAEEQNRTAVRVSIGDPFAACTIGGTPDSVGFPAAEVEPDLAVDPHRPSRLVGAFQQDRWNNGGAKGVGVVYSSDGGRHFTETTMPVSSCAPGGLNYERASDPWVSIGPDGTVYGSTLAFDANTPRNTVAATVSYDGGRTWRHQVPLIDDTSLQFFNDKNSVTADPNRPGTAYQVWDRIDGGPDGTLLLTAPTLLSVTHDFGRTWSSPRVIVATGQFQQTIGNIVVADPTRPGRLYNVYETTTYTDATAETVASASFGVIRSEDFGRTWTAPVTIGPDSSVVDTDPNTGQTLRTGAGLPSVAIDPRTGELYVVFEGTDFTGGGYNQVELVHSTDRGAHWSRPVRVNGVPTVPAFTPTVAVTAEGDVGVTYYDIRTLQPGNTTTLPTSVWLTVSPRGGARFGHERQLGAVFDFLQAPRAHSPFLGDYQGLTASGDRLRALFVTANPDPGNRSDVWTVEVPAFTDARERDTAPLSAQAAPLTLVPRANHQRHTRPTAA